MKYPEIVTILLLNRRVPGGVVLSYPSCNTGASPRCIRWTGPHAPSTGQLARSGRRSAPSVQAGWLV